MNIKDVEKNLKTVSLPPLKAGFLAMYTFGTL